MLDEKDDLAPRRRPPVLIELRRQAWSVKQQSPLSLPLQLSIGALVLLGMVGGSLIVANSGFETSPRRGGSPTFVSAPEAYALAAVMYAMSGTAAIALFRNRTNSLRAFAVAGVWVRCDCCGFGVGFGATLS
jgi:hypothetical protein